MTDFLLKIIDAIRAIDGGCSSCIVGFLTQCYEVEPFDIGLVIEKLNVTGITKEEVESYIEDRILVRENP